MATAAIAPDVLELVTVPGVELVDVGTWQSATGEWTFTLEDLQAAIAAYDDPGYCKPVIKLGHVPLRGVEWPAMGRIDNVRLNADKTTLIGDFVGVPRWLAEAMPTAFPTRSIEAEFGYRTQTGTTHKFALTGVALLGETLPAISTLEDVKSLLTNGGVLTASANDGTGRVTLTRNATGAPPRVSPTATVHASVSIDQLREAFYDTQPNGSWAWIRECYVGDDAFIIVDNDEGDLYRIPWSEASGTITFGAPSKVVIEYVPAPAGDGEPEGGLVLLSRDPIPATRKVVASVPLTEEQLTEIGLPADADAEAVTTRLLELGQWASAERDAALEAATAPSGPSTLELPEGVTVIDETTLEELKVAASRGNTAHETLRTQERDRFINDAVKAGKFASSRIAHFQALYDVDEAGTRDTITKLAANTVPVTALGHEGEGDLTGDDALFNALYPETAAAGK